MYAKEFPTTALLAFIDKMNAVSNNVGSSQWAAPECNVLHAQATQLSYGVVLNTSTNALCIEENRAERFVPSGMMTAASTSSMAQNCARCACFVTAS